MKRWQMMDQLISGSKSDDEKRRLRDEQKRMLQRDLLGQKLKGNADDARSKMKVGIDEAMKRTRVTVQEQFQEEEDRLRDNFKKQEEGKPFDIMDYVPKRIREKMYSEGSDKADRRPEDADKKPPSSLSL
eukprot:JP437648.1.p1 GENE.JP437648.1~~JP437648.1.p1  ORF type:complete len:130 (+),score=1.52 JP437648.1:2-391(+)